MARRRGSQLFRQLLLPQPFILILVQLCRGARAALAGGPQVQIPLLILICTPALRATAPISPATLDQTVLLSLYLKPDLASGGTGTRLVPVSPEFLGLSIQPSREAPALRLPVGPRSRPPPHPHLHTNFACSDAMSFSTPCQPIRQACQACWICACWWAPGPDSPPHPHLHARIANQDVISSSRSSKAV